MSASLDRMLLDELRRRGPRCLDGEAFDRVAYHMPESARGLFQHLLQSMREEQAYLDRARETRNAETERIAAIGATMRKAGLRSYTDKDGNIYVAGDAS